MRPNSACYVLVDAVVAPDGNALAAPVRHLPRGLIDRAWHVVRGRSAGETSTSHVNRGAGPTKFEGNPAARTAAGAGHQGDCIVQTCHVTSSAVWVALSRR